MASNKHHVTEATEALTEIAVAEPLGLVSSSWAHWRSPSQSAHTNQSVPGDKLLIAEISAVLSGNMQCLSRSNAVSIRSSTSKLARANKPVFATSPLLAAKAVQQRRQASGASS
jgi:hypothetical protein